MIVLLDSNILIDMLRGRGDRTTQLTALVASGNVLAVSVVTVAEIYAGMRPAEQARTDVLINGMVAYPLTTGIARRAGLLKRQAASHGLTIGLPDTLIAATAIEMSIPLLTDNRKDFPFPELQLFNAIG